MAELVLEVVRREKIGKELAKKLRKDGKVPAIVYGGHKESVAITVDRKSVSELVTKSDHGVRSIFLLKMADSDQSRHAMIREIQLDPINRKIKHIDFVRVVMDELIRVTVPIQVTGLANGVKNGGGILDLPMRELHVECLPGAIPDFVEADVTPLEIHDSLRISDLKIPEGVRILDDPERVVASITLMRAEVVVEPTEQVVAAEPELIKKGKVEVAEE